MEITTPIAPPERRNIAGLVCFLALNVADCVLTWWLLSLGGTELNWYGMLLQSMPTWAVLALKMTIVVGIAALVYKYRRHLFKYLNIGMGIIVTINIVPTIAYLAARGANL